MKRSIWVTVCLWLQGLWTLALLGLAVYMLILLYPRRARDWKSQALTYALLSLLHGIGWYGLWRRKVWGWWLALTCSWVVAARIVYVVTDTLVANGWSVIDWAFFVLASYLILPIWLVTPATRKYYWSASKVSDASFPA